MDSKKRLWIYAGLTLTAGVGLVSLIVPPTALVHVGSEKPVRGTSIMLLGDSIAQGLAVPLRALVVAEGGTLPSLTRVGSRLDQWAKDIQTVLAGKTPSVVLLSLGTNDMKRTSISSVPAEVQTILAAVRAVGAEPVWILPPTMPFPDPGIRAALEASGARVFHSEVITIPRATDRIHPTPAGYAGFAANIWQWLAPAPSASMGAVPGPYRVTRPKRAPRARTSKL